MPAPVRVPSPGDSSQALRAGRDGVLEMIATGAPLADVLTNLVLLIESQTDGMIASIVLLDEDGEHLRHGAAPSLPVAYIESIDGLTIGPQVGSCGTAMYRGEPVIVSDIQKDPLWENYRQLAARFSLRACWSTPIQSPHGKVLGCFAMYYHEPRSPSHVEARLTDIGVHIAGIAIEHERTEVALRASEAAWRSAEQRYRNILENTHEGIFQMAKDGRCLAANPAMAMMLGFDSPADLINDGTRPCGGYLEHTNRAEFRRSLDETGTVNDFEFQVWRKDGSKIWISENVRAVSDERGALLFYEGTAQDITKRKSAEVKSAGFAALARKLSGAVTSRRAAQIIADTAHDLFGWDSLNLDLYDAAQDILQPVLNVDTVEGQLVDVTQVGSAFPLPAPRRRVLQRGAELLGGEDAARDSAPAADQAHAVVMSVPVRHAADVVGILSIQSYAARAYDEAALGDLQALADHCGEALNRIRTEQSLRDSEERYRELFENAKDAIYVHDLRGRYTSINHAAERLTGYSREEILGKSFADFVVPEHTKGVRDNLCRKLADGTQSVYEVELLTRQGRRVPVEVNSRLIYENGIAVGVQGTVRDITERKQSQAALRSFSRRLMAAQEAERQRLSRELHDEIGQVLTAVRINLEAVQRDSSASATPSPIKDSLSVIDEALRRVRSMSLDLRPPHLDDFGLSSALRWYVDSYSKRSASMVLFIDDQPPGQPRLRRDLETACFRIAQEALTNVARHANAKSVIVKVTRSNGNLWLSIEDDGAGFEVGALRKEAIANATLGVRGMEERADAVGGRLEIESVIGKGTRISACFPVAAT